MLVNIALGLSLLALLIMVCLWLAIKAQERSTTSRYVILSQLQKVYPDGQHGRELVKVSNGMLKNDSVHKHLSRMETAGLIHSWPQNSETDPKVLTRRLYQLTNKGLTALTGR
jgi:DNA-binding PadR family transcriptional regulator